MSVKALSSKAKIRTAFPESSDHGSGIENSGLRTHTLRDVNRLEDVLQKSMADF